MLILVMPCMSTEELTIYVKSIFGVLLPPLICSLPETPNETFSCKNIECSMKTDLIYVFGPTYLETVFEKKNF